MTVPTGKLLAAVAVVVVAAGVVTAIVLSGGDDDETPRAASPTTTTSTSLSPLEQACLINGGTFRVRVYFSQEGTDEHMRRAADALRDDDRVAELTTETQQQAYERFKVVFKDQPDLVEQVRPDSLPASIEALPAEGISNTELARDLEKELTGVDSVEERACEA